MPVSFLFLARRPAGSEPSGSEFVESNSWS